MSNSCRVATFWLISIPKIDTPSPYSILVTFVVTGFGKNYGRAEYRGRFGALYAYFWDSSFDASKELNQPVLDVHDCSSL